MLALPRDLGKHPETGEQVSAGVGRFGPYIKHGSKYTSLKEDSVLTVTLERAVDVIAEAAKKAAEKGSKKTAAPKKAPAKKKPAKKAKK